MMVTKLGYQHILVATDFSAASVSSSKLSVWLSRQFGSNLVLAHTLPDLHRAVHAASFKARMDLLSGDGEIFDREIRQNSDSRLRETIIALDASDIDVKFDTLLGEVFIEITHAVHEEGSWHVKSHCRCEKSTARRFFTNNIVVRDRKTIPQS